MQPPHLHDHGAEGVRSYLEGMTDELRAMMARTCCKNLDSIPSDVLWNAFTGNKLIP